MQESRVMAVSALATTHLTPPDRTPPSLSHRARSGSWPHPLSRVEGWRKGGKETMEDVLEESGCGLRSDDVVEVVRRMVELGVEGAVQDRAGDAEEIQAGDGECDVKEEGKRGAMGLLGRLRTGAVSLDNVK